jgi:hypothetical protein
MIGYGPGDAIYFERLAEGENPNELILELLEDRMILREEREALDELLHDKDERWKAYIRLKYLSLTEGAIIGTVALLIGLLIGTLVVGR